jgi:hypothetical protein
VKNLLYHDKGMRALSLMYFRMLSLFQPSVASLSTVKGVRMRSILVSDFHPRRRVSPPSKESFAIHPDVQSALRAFHSYNGDHVLVAAKAQLHME